MSFRKLIFLGISLNLSMSLFLYAENQKAQMSPITVQNSNFDKKFEPFTGKVKKTKVRLRVQPNYESQIYREIEPGELFLVVGENDEFFAVKPSKDFRAYIFRTFVLDNIVEGNRVNVRLFPDLDAPVIAQLNSGDKIEGNIDTEAPKWLKIIPPETVTFYIGKDYVEKVGQANFLELQEKRKQQATQILSEQVKFTEEEWKKPFEKITIENIKRAYEHVMNEYSDYPEIASRAELLLDELQKQFIERKINYLEMQSKMSTSKSEDLKKLNQELQSYKNKILDLQQQVEQSRLLPVEKVEDWKRSAPPVEFPVSMSAWLPTESAIFDAWSRKTGNFHQQDFYSEQYQQAKKLRGVVEVYYRPVKNKPGNFLLVNPISQLPIAYLYSTSVNLQQFVGKESTLLVSPRPNSDFAYPAYFVLGIE